MPRASQTETKLISLRRRGGGGKSGSKAYRGLHPHSSTVIRVDPRQVLLFGLYDSARLTATSSALTGACGNKSLPPARRGRTQAGPGAGRTPEERSIPDGF